MQLLQEEFFGKIWKFIKEMKVIPMRWICKILFFAMVLAIFSFIAWMIYTKKYVWLAVFVGIIILGELAHFIRKSREKVMNKIIETNNDLEDEARNPLNKGKMVLRKEEWENKKKVKKVFKEKVFNKDGLLRKKKLVDYV